MAFITITFSSLFESICNFISKCHITFDLSFF